MKRILIICCLSLLLCIVAAQAATMGVFSQPERPAIDTDPWHNKLEPLWNRVLEAERTSPGFTRDGEHFGPVDRITWKNLVTYSKTIPELELFRSVNGYFNQWRPKNDEDTWNSPEYWSSPKEFLQHRGGDCEDYAIAKYFGLRSLGLDADRMRVVIVRRKDERGIYARELHAILAVRANGTWFILDNNARPRNNIFPHTQYQGRFDPLYSMNENDAWVHGTQVGMAVTLRHTIVAK